MFPITKYLLYFLTPIWYKDYTATEKRVEDTKENLNNQPLEEDDTNYKEDDMPGKNSYKDALLKELEKKIPTFDEK